VAIKTTRMSWDNSEFVAFDYEPDPSKLDPIVSETASLSGTTGAKAFNLQSRRRYQIRGASWEACAAMHEAMEGAHAFWRMADGVADVAADEEGSYAHADAVVRQWLASHHHNPGFVASLANVLLSIADDMPVKPRINDPSTFRSLSDDYQRKFDGVTVDDQLVVPVYKREPWPATYSSAADMSEERWDASSKVSDAQILVQRTKTLAGICSEIIGDISPQNDEHNRVAALVEAICNGLGRLDEAMDVVGAAISKIGREPEATEGGSHE
jgi:hypothetical protein